jgi:hypothetical protein
VAKAKLDPQSAAQLKTKIAALIVGTRRADPTLEKIARPTTTAKIMTHAVSRIPSSSQISSGSKLLRFLSAEHLKSRTCIEL